MHACGRWRQGHAANMLGYDVILTTWVTSTQSPATKRAGRPSSGLVPTPKEAASPSAHSAPSAAAATRSFCADASAWTRNHAALHYRPSTICPHFKHPQTTRTP